MPDATESPKITKRLRYFDGQFLQARDFTDEQLYHLDRLRRHERLFHTPGIAEGLRVLVTEPAGGSVILAVEPGTALDARGRMIVLSEERELTAGVTTGGALLVYVSYREVASDQAGEGGEAGGAGHTRWTEDPLVEVLAEGTAPASEDAILLARFQVSERGALTEDPSVRRYAGHLLPSETPSESPVLVSAAPGRADLEGDLRLSGRLTNASENAGIAVDPDGGIEATGTLRVVAPGAPLTLQGNGGTKPVGITQNQVGGFATLELTTSDRDDNQATRVVLRGSDDRANIEFYRGERGDERLSWIFHGSGNFGIGAARPTIALAIRDDNTGLNRPTANNLAIVTGGSERIRIDASGNVGIGTTPSNGKLEVAGTLVAESLSVARNNDQRGALYLATPGDFNHAFFNNASNIDGEGTFDGAKFNAGEGFQLRVGFNRNRRTALAVGTNGNVGIGATGPTILLAVGDNNTGLNRPSANNLAVVTGGSERIRIDDSGNVGIGTAPSNRKLEVAGALVAESLSVARSNDQRGALYLASPGDFNHALYNNASNIDREGSFDGAKLNAGEGFRLRVGFRGNRRTAVAVGTDGNVGIGETEPRAKLDVTGGRWDLFASEGDLRIGNDSYRLKIGVALGGTGAGDVHIAAHGGTNRLRLGTYFEGDQSPHIAYPIFLWNGTAFGSLRAPSDARLKRNLRRVRGALDRLLRLRGVGFSWKEGHGRRGAGLGIVGQEVERVFPELVTPDGDGMLSVDYSGLLAPVIEAIRELKAQIDELREARLGRRQAARP